MSKYTIFKITGTTDGSGDATADTSRVVRGRIMAVALDIDAFDATADVTISTPDGVVNQNVVNLTNNNTAATIYPKKLAVDNTGGALTATGNIYSEYVVFSRLRATIAQGGASKAFTIAVYVEEF